MNGVMCGARIVVSLAASLAGLGPRTLRITDTKGVETIVSSVAVDYGSFWSPDVDSTGIRVLRGDAEVLLRWMALDTLRALRQTDSTPPQKIEFDATMRGGKGVRVALLRKGRMKLTGTADLGAYSIDLDSGRMIIPIR
jgi:hypothetical protein